MKTIRDCLMILKIDEMILEAVKDDEEKRDKINEKIIEDKREYRKALKGRWQDRYLYPGKDCNGYGEIVAVGGEGDSFWEKVFFEGEHWTPEEKQEFIDDNWQSCTPSQYDCTGQIFTWAIDVFNVPRGVVAYLRYAMDV